MRLRNHLLLFLTLPLLVCLAPVTGPTAQAQSNNDACVSPDEARLVKLINQYRRTKGLPAVAISPAMQKVARIHARDLAAHPPSGRCNMHSWSKNGNWKPCCYTSDHKQAQCMWSKPRELAGYPGHGFEISYGGSGRATPEGALAGWKRSSGHNTVIINAGRWKKPWGAIGAGISAGYAVVWFGWPADPAGVAPPCSR